MQLAKILAPFEGLIQKYYYSYKKTFKISFRRTKKNPDFQRKKFKIIFWPKISSIIFFQFFFCGIFVFFFYKTNVSKSL